MSLGPLVSRTWRHDRSGISLLDACAALALSSIAAVVMVRGAKPMACAIRVETARSTLIDSLLEARRSAYEMEAKAWVEARAGSSSVAVRPSGKNYSLGDGVALQSVPADGTVSFQASGLADNATLVLACTDATASVVVNQRGVIR
ncbi:MAG TPA: hypothetical protein VGK20_18510 [Candidatus Binatia bacterium]